MAEQKSSEKDNVTTLPEGPNVNLYEDCVTYDDYRRLLSPSASSAREHMKQACEVLIEQCCITPPPPQVPPPPRAIMLPDLNIDTIAEAFQSHNPKINRFNDIDRWTQYDPDTGLYSRMQDLEVQRMLRQMAPRFVVQKQGRNGTYYERFNPTIPKINSLEAQLKVTDGIYLGNHQIAPAALSPEFEGKTIIPMLNGLLDITDRFNPVLLPPSPGYYSYNYLPYNYNPDATCPTWDECIKQYFVMPDGSADEQARIILHGFIYRYLIRHTKFQKMLVIVGLPRSGKGTMGQVITQLIGRHNVASINLNQIGQHFGFESVVGKSLGIIWDAGKLDKRGGTSATTEMVKSITGGDPITVPRKYKSSLQSIQLQMNMLAFSNAPLDLRDNTGGFSSRLFHMETQGSFLGRVDIDIPKKLTAELPGILNKVLQAPLADGKKPLDYKRSGDLALDARRQSNAFWAFAEDWLEWPAEEDWGKVELPEEPKVVVWMYYKAWCHSNDRQVPNQDSFQGAFKYCGIKVTNGMTRTNSSKLLEELNNRYSLSKIKGGWQGAFSSKVKHFKGVRISKHARMAVASFDSAI